MGDEATATTEKTRSIRQKVMLFARDDYVFDRTCGGVTPPINGVFFLIAFSFAPLMSKEKAKDRFCRATPMLPKESPYIGIPRWEGSV